MNPVPRPAGRWRAIGTASAVSIATLIPGLGLAGIAAAPAQAADPVCTTSGSTTTCTLTYTGATQPLNLPGYVRLATFQVVGAAGGTGTDGRGLGGRGGSVTATLELQPGTPIAVNVGGKGADRSGLGGWNGGGNGAGATTPSGGGGGGATEVIVGGQRVLIGGGGGGGGTVRFGEAGLPVPGNGGNGGGAVPAGGAAPGGQGANSTNSVFTASGGGAGSSTAGAAGGGSLGFVIGGCSTWVAAYGGPGESARVNLGGAGGHLNSPQGQPCVGASGWGGGGGGGYQGGGGGGAGVAAGAGGGGGSGYGPAGSTNSLGAPGANGVVTVTYQEPVTTAWFDTRIQTIGNPTVVARAGSDRTADVFYIDQNYNAVQRTYIDGAPASQPRRIGSETWRSGSRLAAVSSGPDRIDLFARGDDDALWQSSFVGAGWTPWRRVSNAGTVDSSPAVTTWGGGRLDVFWRSGSAIKQMTSTSGGAAWTPPVTISQDAMSSPTAVSSAPGRIDVLFNRQPSAMPVKVGWLRYTAAGGWDAERTAFEDLLDSIAFVTSPSNGVLDAYYKDGAQLVKQQYSDTNGRWLRSDVGPAPSGVDATVAVAPSPKGYPFGLATTRSNGTIFIRGI